MTKQLARIALWIIALLVIAHGLQACGTSRPASQSKFDQPQHRIHKSRW